MAIYSFTRNLLAADPLLMLLAPGSAVLVWPPSPERLAPGNRFYLERQAISSSASVPSMTHGR